MGCTHNPEHECFDCATARHAAEHPELVDGCLSCKLSTIQVSPRVAGRKPPNPAAGSKNMNSWERGRMYDERGVPLHDSQGHIPVKRYGERRHEYEDARRRLRSQQPAAVG